jgi:hypothetical protein
MNERLLLFLDNVEKIRLFLGSHAESFVFSMATQLTLRGQRFYGFDYDEVNKTIKKNSKWYSTVRHSSVMLNKRTIWRCCDDLVILSNSYHDSGRYCHLF